MHTPTPELIRAALTHIPASLPREDWAKLAMAIKSEYPDETGLDLFDSWSQSAGAGYSQQTTRATWRSVKAGGGVGVGTLLHLAQQNGFVIPKPNQAATPPSAEALAQREQDRQAAAVAEQSRIEEAQASAAQEASQRWAQAS